MKRLFSGILLIAILVFGITGCSSQNGDEGNADTEQQNETYTINIAHSETEDRSIHQSAVLFKEFIETESEGRILVNILPNGEAGGETEFVESTSMGILEMCMSTSAIFGMYNEDFGILDLPFIFASREAAYSALDGELGRILGESLESSNLITLGYNDCGLRQMTNSVRPIATLEDLKGIKMRVMESQVYIQMFENLGANPVPMSFSEVYTALQMGTIEGQENSASIVTSSKLYEVQKYLSLTNHVYSMNAIVVNKPWFEGIPPELQDIIKAGTQQCLITEQRNMESGSDEANIQECINMGMEVNAVTEENMEALRMAVSPMYDEYKATIDQSLFDMIDEANAAHPQV